jgi:hypothetical protein
LKVESRKKEQRRTGDGETGRKGAEEKGRKDKSNE